jgi:hypothetical protein
VADQAAAGTVTVRDLLAVAALGLRLLAAPDRIDGPIRWAHPTELVDPTPYLTGGELVLTVGTSIVPDADRCHAFVERLVEAGARALGYGVGDVTAEVPAALVTACREVGLPLLEVPPDVPFQAITELLADRRAEARAAGERRVQRLATRLLDAIAGDVPLAGLLELVESELGGSVTFEGGVLRWTPLTASDVEPSRTTLRHIESVLAVHQHEWDVAFAHRRAETGRLLRLVAAGKADAVVLADALQEAEVPTQGAVVVAAWPVKAAALVAGAIGAAVFADLTGDASGSCLSISVDHAAVLQAATDHAVPCGVAAPCHVADLASAFPAALAALDLSRRRGTPATHRDLMSFEGLLEQQPGERLHPFVQSLLVPLIEHDHQHGTALVATLRAFLHGDGSVNATARHLHLHPNSLRHRLKRIAELTGSDPRVFADRVALAIGLWAWDRRPRGRR